MQTLVRCLVVGLAACASVATSAPRYVRNYPAWRVLSESSRPMGCAQVEAWVSKSGKSGVGVTLRLSGGGAGPACRVAVRGARLTVAARSAVATVPEGAFTLAPGAQQLVYLPFAFDNNAAWNEGARDGTLELELASDDAPPATWKLALRHEYDGPHVDRFRTGPAR